MTRTQNVLIHLRALRLGVIVFLATFIDLYLKEREKIKQEKLSHRC